VEKLWKSGQLARCKFGFSLRIWHFAQDFVNRAFAAGKTFYFICIQQFKGMGRSRQSGFARVI